MILADELLEQFFETFFPTSFRLSTTPAASTTPVASSTLSGNLTTFSSLGTPVKNLVAGAGSNKTVVDVGSAGGVVEPGSRGIRGVLDNIVSDGMRMAAEMRKRMDDTQREIEKNARDGQQRSSREDEEDDEEDDEKTTEAGNRDADLLEGAEVASIKTMRSNTMGSENGSNSMTSSREGDVPGEASSGASRATSILDMPALGQPKVEFKS